MTTEDRFKAGIEGLDVLLDGGFVRGGVCLFMGNPGTGKTTIGSQMCFEHVKRGGRAVYVTLLAETHSRLLRNLSQHDFFDPSVIGDTLFFVGGYMTLREKRLDGLLQMVRQIMRNERPTLLVLDGLASAYALGETEMHVKELIAELQVMSDMANCTTIILANISAASATAAEHSMVDGMIELTLLRNEQRTLRQIEILKCRGVDHLLGTHDLQITQAGIVVRPRTEVILARRGHTAPPTRHVRRGTGVENLDAMLGGGFLSGSTTMLLGFSGSGKTMLAMHFLNEGAEQGEPGLYFGFYESPARLVEAAEHVKLPIEKHVAAGTIEIIRQPPLKASLDAFAETIFDDVARRNVKRVVIDGIDGFRQSSPFRDRTIRFVTALVDELRARDVTLLITEETMKLFGPEVDVRIEGLSALVENILLLEYRDVGSEIKRILTIIKQRGSGYEGSVRELCITDRGIVLAPTPESARLILRATMGPGPAK